MDAIGIKLARQFKLTAEEVSALRAAGLSTGRQIKAARVVERTDFTVIPNVGKEINTALHNAGFNTCADLTAAEDAALLGISGIGPALLGKIRAYLAARR